MPPTCHSLIIVAAVAAAKTKKKEKDNPDANQHLNKCQKENVFHNAMESRLQLFTPTCDDVVVVLMLGGAIVQRVNIHY